MFEFIIPFALGFGLAFYIDHSKKVAALESKVADLVKPQA